MALFVRCRCGRRNTLDQTVCGKCGEHLPPQSEPRLCVVRVYRPETKTNIVRSLGRCSLREARRLEKGIAQELAFEDFEKATEESGEVIPRWSAVARAFLEKKRADGAGDTYLKDTERYLRQLGEAFGDAPVN